MIYSTLNQMKAKILSKGKYADGQRLWFVKSNKISGKWILRLYCLTSAPMEQIFGIE